MTIHTEQRGSCLIEAGARDLQHGGHWQPWLRLTPRADTGCAGRTFDCLKPVFGTEQAALRYATELGRTLAGEGTVTATASRRQGPATWPLYQAFARFCARWSAVRTAASIHLILR